jgi:hypothetical protein
VVRQRMENARAALKAGKYAAVNLDRATKGGRRLGRELRSSLTLAELDSSKAREDAPAGPSAPTARTGDQLIQTLALDQGKPLGTGAAREPTAGLAGGVRSATSQAEAGRLVRCAQPSAVDHANPRFPITIWSRTPSALRSSATRDRPAGRQGKADANLSTNRPLACRPDRAGSSPWETVIDAAQSECGIVRGCRFKTAGDCREWPADGRAVRTTAIGSSDVGISSTAG